MAAETPLYSDVLRTGTPKPPDACKKTRHASAPASSTSTKPSSTGDSGRAMSAGSARTSPREEFGKEEIEKWLKQNLDWELKIENAPLFYSTTLDLSQDRPTPKLSDPSKPMRTLKEENVRDPLLTKLNLLADYTQSGRPYNPKLNIQLEYLLKQGKVGRSTFVCQSDLLVEVGSTTSCYKKTGPKIAVEKIGQAIYMYRYAFHSKDKVPPRKAKQNRNEYVGLKFEEYMTQEWFNRNEKFWALVEAKLGDHELIISGEVDCVDGKGDLVELKTSLNDIEDFRFPEKLKWWLQCYLLGVKTIVVGKHDCQRECSRVRKLAVDKLRKDLDDSKIFLATIHKFLTKVDQHCQIATTAKEHRKIDLFVRDEESSFFTVKRSVDPRDQFIKEGIVQELIAKNRPKPTATSTNSAALSASIRRKAI